MRVRQIEGEYVEKEIVDGYMAQGRMLLSKGLYQKAAEFFVRALEEDPLLYEAYVEKAVCLINMDFYKEAKAALSKAQIVDKDNPLAYFHLGNLAMIQGDITRGIENYNRALELGYSLAEVSFHLGLAYEGVGNIDMAIRSYTKAEKAEPLNPGYKVRKALLYMESGRFREALQTLDGLRICSPDYFEGWHLAAACHLALGEESRAEAVIDKAVELFPEDRGLVFDKVRILSARGQQDKALSLLSALEREAETKEERQVYVMERGKIYGRLNKTMECLKVFEGLKKEEGKTYEEVCFYLMNLYLAQNRYQEVCENAEELIKRGEAGQYGEPGYYYFALALNKMGKTQDAEKAYKDAISYYRRKNIEDPGKMDGYIYRAFCWRDLKDYGKALEILDYVILLVPDQAVLFTLKADIYKEMSYETNSVAEMEKAEKIERTKGIQTEKSRALALKMPGGAAAREGIKRE